MRRCRSLTNCLFLSFVDFYKGWQYNNIEIEYISLEKHFNCLANLFTYSFIYSFMPINLVSYKNDVDELEGGESHRMPMA